ncbi:UbiD family decarboxylase [Rubeoparvulum massiliense]|uniref:UbiD family decarboxylase n=1 Tax=Rubeoparvulum massiliense TaxID=1631346 RepID=UPI00065DD2B8|nr:UbiD family decarboxylase [Rubeoparvulum massiliense]
MHTNLRSFIEVLQQEGELVTIDAPVDPYLELAEIHRRVITEEGPALLFTNVKGSPFPVITNMFGTMRRVDLCFGPKPEAFVRQLVGAVDHLMPPRPSALWQERKLFYDLLKIGTKRVSANRAPISEVRSEQVQLTKLPALTSWSEDGGPFVTLPLVYTEDPHTKQHNLGMYRIQIYDDQHTGIHWQIHKGGGFHYYEAEQMNQPLPLTLMLGGPPALIITAIAPLPEKVPELVFTSLLMNDKVHLYQEEGYPHPLVAEAEFAFGGLVPPHERRLEGPFGDHYGYYSLAHDFPIFHVKKMWRRKDAIYPATVVGKPIQEDYHIGDYLQRLISPLFPMVMPGVKALKAYADTGVHALAGAIVRESYYREALATGFRILGEGQLTLTKFLMLTDVPCNLEKFDTLLESILARFQPARDLMIINDTSMDTLDYTGRQFNKGSKAIMIGIGQPIRQLSREYRGGQLPGVHDAQVYCGGCLVVSGPTYEEDPEFAQHLVDEAQEQLTGWPLVILTDDASIAQRSDLFLWSVFTRFDPAYDIYARSEIRRNKICYEGAIIIDARMKPFYPDTVETDPATKALVDERWNQYFK